MTTLKSNMLKKGKKGFTLTELAIVIAVIAILIAVLVPTFTSVITSAKETAAEEDATNAITAYTLEQIDNGNYDTLADGSIIKSGDYCFVVIGGNTYLEDDLSETDKTTYADRFDAAESGSGLAAAGLTEYTWDTNGDYATTFASVKIYTYSEETAAAAAAAAAAATNSTNTGSSGANLTTTTTYYAAVTVGSETSASYWFKLTYDSTNTCWTAEASDSATYTACTGTATSAQTSASGYSVTYNS